MADPLGARAHAEGLLTAARGDRDVAGQAKALRVLGLAAHQLQDGPLAARHLRHSVRLAERHGLSVLAAESRMSLSLVLDDLGRQATALREIDRAVAALRGAARARARMQRGILLRRMGRESEALEAYGAALASFRRGNDLLWQARALTNRGVLLAYRGGIGQARADLTRAEALYAELGLTTAVAQVRHNLGFVAAQAGDVVTALECYAQADIHFQRTGQRPAVALIDRAELLLAARLLPEARRMAEAAVRAALEARLASQVAQARLLLAQAALASGDNASARGAARQARRAFERLNRPRFVVLARYLELRSSNRDSPERLERVAAELDAAGWPEQALEARIHGGRPSGGNTRHGPARVRIRAWHAEALARWRNGDHGGALRAVRAGLRLLDQYRAALGATELRVLSSADGADLAALGMRLSLVDGRPDRVLRWAERWRAATLRLRPTQTLDEELVAQLARLRRVGSELANQADPQQRQRLLREQHALEDGVRHRTWRATGEGSVVDTMPEPDQIAATLGDRALLELVEQDGQLIAVVLAHGRIRLRDLASATAVGREAAALRFAMRRLVHRHGSVESLAAARASAQYSLERLNDWLLEPVASLIGAAELVIVPTGALQALPWSALPGCAGRPVTIAPSATAWWRASAVPSRREGTVLIGAPAPEDAIPEVRALARQLGGSEVLVGERATVHAALSAMDGARHAHVAAHGAFRADNPLFSYLRLADGPLTGHDLTGLRRAPRLMVLSACDTGLSSVHPGDELLGLTATLLSAGTGTLVASIGPVRDASTLPLMMELHRRLGDGQPPAQALVAAREAAGDWATAHSFACFGAGTH